MMKIQIKNETNRLRAVVLGTAQSNGPTPTSQEAYDPKSLEHILAGTYPVEADMVTEMEAFAQVLTKNGVCLLYTSPSPRALSTSRMPSSSC